MRKPTVDEFVRLTHDVPQHRLHKDDVGVICSIWHSPEAYEVEFHHQGEENDDTRVLLLPEQFRVDSSQAPEAR